MLAFFSACAPRVIQGVALSPSILSIVAECSRDANQWEVRVFTDAWTGGGSLFFGTQDSHEVHDIDSIRAAPNGDSDELLLVLPIETNPEEAASNKSSAFLCTDEVLNSLTWRVAVLDYQSETEADCWYWGEEVNLEELDYEPCERRAPSES